MKKPKFFILSFLLILFVSIASFAGTTLYTYDSLYRLTGVEYGGWTKVEYSYDEVGNRLARTVTTGTALVNTPSGFTNSPSASLNLSCTLINGTCTEMQFSNDGIAWSNSVAYSTTATWDVGTGEGAHTVYVKFRDNFSNWSPGIYNTTVTLDTVPPTGWINVNSGATCTKSSNVTIVISASDSNGVSQMMFSNDNLNWFTPEAYSTTKAWTLPAGNGLKTVYAKVKDNAGNWSNSMSASITVDSTGSCIPAPTITHQWTVQDGTPESDTGKAIAVDSQGNLYIAGKTAGSLGGANSGGLDAVLLKLDPSGTILWTTQFGTTLDDDATGIAIDQAGNVYVSGTTMGAFPQQTNAGGRDAYIARLDANGSMVWLKQFGGVSNEYATGVAADSLGNIYVTGYTGSSLEGFTNAGLDDIYLVKFSPDGTRLWIQETGTPALDRTYGITIDQTDNVYIAGYIGAVLEANPYFGETDAVLLKFDTNGNRLLTKVWGTTVSDVAEDVAVDSTGIYVTGFTYGNMNGNINAGDNTDAFIIKFDLNGNQLWVNQLATTGNEIARKIVLDTQGHSYIAGYTSGSLDDNPNLGLKDVFITKYDASGAKLWTKQIGTGFDEEANGMIFKDNNLYIGGYTAGLLGNISSGLEDLFVMKFSEPSNSYIITASAGQGGSITPSGNVSVNGGADQTFTITPAEGYRIYEVLVDGVSFGAVSTYTFTNITANHTISAEFVPIGSYVIKATAGPHGSITPSGNVQVLAGAINVRFEWTGDDGYRTWDVIVDGVSQGPLYGWYYFSNVYADHTIEVHFSSSIVISSGLNGRIRSSWYGWVEPGTTNTIWLFPGADQTFTFSPSTDYHVADVLVDGVSVGPVTSYTLTNITEKHTVSASFAQNDFMTITATAGPNGSISPSGTIVVPTGSDLTFTATPAPDYDVWEICVVGVMCQAFERTYTLYNIRSSHTIEATFEYYGERPMLGD